MLAPRIFEVFRGVRLLALRRGLAALLQLERVLAQSMTGTLVLAATARGGVLITSSLTVEAENWSIASSSATLQSTFLLWFLCSLLVTSAFYANLGSKLGEWGVNGSDLVVFATIYAESVLELSINCLYT